MGWLSARSDGFLPKLDGMLLVMDVKSPTVDVLTHVVDGIVLDVYMVISGLKMGIPMRCLGSKWLFSPH